MAWPEWNLALAPEIARFVTPAEAVRLGLRPRTAGDLRNDPAALAAAIYDELRSRQLGYTSTVLGENGNQIVQTPAEVLEHGTPNCVDLTTLFAAACLASELVPLVTLITKADNTRHALVWLVPNADARSRKATDLGKVGGVGHITKVGRSEVDELLIVADAQAWIPVETTGLSRSVLWADESGAATSIPFERSVEVARKVLTGATKVDLVDVHRLQRDGLQLWTPPELAEAERQLAEAQRRQTRRRVLTGATVGVVVLVAASIFVWPRPFDDDPLERMTAGFNIAVAGLDAGDSASERDAQTVPSQLATSLADAYSDDTRYLVWGPDQVGTVKPSDAADVAEELQSDVIVYGELVVDAADDDIYDVVVRVNSSHHGARSPWPIKLDESVSLTVPISNVRAGVFESTPSILSLTRTLDGMAALLADAHDTALDRLVAAQDAIGEGGPALIPALRAWTLLAAASFAGDPSQVAEARVLADEALRRDPSSEFARIVSVSVEYMSIIPAQPSVASAGCEPPPPPAERADLDEVNALRTSIEAMRADLSPTGQVQLTSILGRLAISEALLTADAAGIDLSAATAHFEAILEQADGDAALRIWEADAHRWLGLLADVDTTVAADVIIDHFIASADVATPVWKSRAYGLAGRTARCSPDDSPVDAVCFFELAARRAQTAGLTDDVGIYEVALDEMPETCPDDWTVSTR